MTKLTETQTTILKAGSQRHDNIAMPLPKGLAGAAAKMAVTKMIERGWLQEVDANVPVPPSGLVFMCKTENLGTKGQDAKAPSSTLYAG